MEIETETNTPSDSLLVCLQLPMHETLHFGNTRHQCTVPSSLQLRKLI